MITSPYSRLDRWLHWIALQPESVRRLSFDLERQFYLPDNPQRAAQGAVYVCGLARSGTTILLRILDEIPELKSLSYRSMPFALAPNLWAAANRPMNRQVAEIRRAHGDGLLVDLDSPEALEEVFWRTFGQPIDDGTGTMGYAPPSPETMAAFADYRALVANPKGAAPAADGKLRRYLSKNNNNLLRLDNLCADPTAQVLLVYRDPVDTARSMHKQHMRFCRAQKEHPFIRRYMDWLGHFEFGLGHRPFAFAKPFMDPGLRPENLNYWLDYWNAVHQYILKKAAHNLQLVNYETLCAQPSRVLGEVFETVALQADVTILANLVRAAAPSKPRGLEPRTSEPPNFLPDAHTEFDPALLQRAHTAHAALRANERNIDSN